LSTNLLQIENEFYSPIRPKRNAVNGETPLEALYKHGVEYIEVRCIDLNPLVAGGIDKQTMQFIDTFLLLCLFKESPKTNNDEYRQITENQRRTVSRGRDPELELVDGDQERNLVEWGLALIEEMRPIAATLNSAHETTDYLDVLATMKARLEGTSLTPAAQLLVEMADNNETYYRMAMRKACEQREQFNAVALAPDVIEKYQSLAAKSLQKQKDIEQSDTISFDDYLAAYYQRGRMIAESN
ncbi:MAG: glutamate--cysteine ligase, partial [Porticoccaceae bacterium]